jgi:hypothetical protein
MIRAYLTGRSQCVCVDGVASDSAHITSGVPQDPGTFAILFIYEWHIGGDEAMLTYLLMWHYNQYLVKACPRRSFHVCLS